MGQNSQDIQAKLQALRTAYAAQLPERIADIEASWRALGDACATPEPLHELHRKLHSMAGSAGTFGLPALGEAARSIEQRLKAWLKDSAQLPPAERGAITDGIAHLWRLAEVPHAASVADAPSAAATDNRVYLLEVDPQGSARLPARLEQLGYPVEIFHEREALFSALRLYRPLALIMDFHTPALQAMYTDALIEYQRTQLDVLPVIFVSDELSFSARLMAVRAGCYAYLEQPIDATTLVDRLDALSADQLTEPYRVMIIDDELELARHYALVLAQQGIETRVLTAPGNLLEQLEAFHPDVVLMDLYMPACTGMELAQMIRQDTRYVSTPIVFLSAETDRAKQYSALMTGGDDFITKPIQDRHLLAMVTTRAQRARTLENAMSRDSLTGLLKHTKIKEQLQVEVARSQRHRTRLGFAMLDIDLFKHINDTYGHPVGDRVIKSLAQLLRQRLRNTDLIGRYGGEEFAVVLPDTDHDGVLTVLEDVRRAFSEIEFEARGQVFTATLSAGVVIYAGCEDINLLIEQADRALYEAKHAGRNRIVSVTL